MYIILSSIIVVLLIVIAVLWCTRPRPITLVDDVPAKDEPRYRVMKLQNELAKYIYTEDGKIKIKVFECKK